MKKVQAVLLRLQALLVACGGFALVAMWWNEEVYLAVVTAFKTHFAAPWAPAVAGICAAIALITLPPWKRVKHSKNTISFHGIHGDVTIELDSVEATLGRVLARKPEVKKIKVKVTPSEDNRRAVVRAEVLMQKNTGAEGAREISNRIANYLADAAVHILGVEEVLKVDLNVRDIVVDAKQLSVALDREAMARTEQGAPAPAVATTSSLPEEPTVAPEPPEVEAPAPPVEEEPPHASLADQWVPVEPEHAPVSEKPLDIPMGVVEEEAPSVTGFELEPLPQEERPSDEAGGIVLERDDEPSAEPERGA